MDMSPKKNKAMDSHDAIMNNIEQAKSGLKKAGDRAGVKKKFYSNRKYLG